MTNSNKTTNCSPTFPDCHHVWVECSVVAINNTSDLGAVRFWGIYRLEVDRGGEKKRMQFISGHSNCVRRICLQAGKYNNLFWCFCSSLLNNSFRNERCEKSKQGVNPAFSRQLLQQSATTKIIFNKSCFQGSSYYRYIWKLFGDSLPTIQIVIFFPDIRLFMLLLLQKRPDYPIDYLSEHYNKHPSDWSPLIFLLPASQWVLIKLNTHRFPMCTGLWLPNQGSVLATLTNEGSAPW